MNEPFDFSRLWLLKKLEKRGTSFGLQEVLTRPMSPFWRAVSSYISVHESGVRTYFAQAYTDTGRLSGVIQVRECSLRPEAEIVYIAPSLSANSETRSLWSQLLAQVCRQAGEQGVQRVFVGSEWGSEETNLLQEEGFSAYAREQILRLAEPAAGQRRGPLSGLRRLEDGDEMRLMDLYLAVTPRRVQWAEGQSFPLSWSASVARGNLRGEEAYILEEEESKAISAFLRLSPGKAGHWLEVVVAPDSRAEVDVLIEFGLERMSGWPRRPVYAAVREYQGGVLPALLAKGFEPYAHQAVLVKHTAVWMKDPFQVRVSGVEKRVEPSTPTVTLANGELMLEKQSQPITNLR